MGAIDKQTLQAAVAVVSDDAALLAELKEERRKLVRDSITNPNFGREFTSGGANGSNATATVTVSKADRLAYLSLVLKHVTAGTSPTSHTKAVFTSR